MDKKRMLIESISLKNFRNFSDFSTSFKDGINVIYGPNGSGKTSILEAIAYLSNPRSFRSARDYQLIKIGEKFFEITGKVLTGKEHHEITINYYYDELKKEKMHILMVLK